MNKNLFFLVLVIVCAAVALFMPVTRSSAAEEEEVPWCEVPETEAVEVNACTYIVDLVEKEACCNQLYYDVLNECLAGLVNAAQTYCDHKYPCPPGLSLSECIDWMWLSGNYDFCVWYYIYSGTFDCGGEANNAYISCING